MPSIKIFCFINFFLYIDIYEFDIMHKLFNVGLQIF